MERKDCHGVGLAACAQIGCTSSAAASGIDDAGVIEPKPPYRPAWPPVRPDPYARVAGAVGYIGRAPAVAAPFRRTGSPAKVPNVLAVISGTVIPDAPIAARCAAM